MDRLIEEAFTNETDIEYKPKQLLENWRKFMAASLTPKDVSEFLHYTELGEIRKLIQSKPFQATKTFMLQENLITTEFIERLSKVQVIQQVINKTENFLKSTAMEISDILLKIGTLLEEIKQLPISGKVISTMSNSSGFDDIIDDFLVKSGVTERNDGNLLIKLIGWSTSLNLWEDLKSLTIPSKHNDELDQIISFIKENYKNETSDLPILSKVNEVVEKFLKNGNDLTSILPESITYGRIQFLRRKSKTNIRDLLNEMKSLLFDVDGLKQFVLDLPHYGTSLKNILTLQLGELEHKIDEQANKTLENNFKSLNDLVNGNASNNQLIIDRNSKNSLYSELEPFSTKAVELINGLKNIHIFMKYIGIAVKNDVAYIKDPIMMLHFLLIKETPLDKSVVLPKLLNAFYIQSIENMKSSGSSIVDTLKDVQDATWHFINKTDTKEVYSLKYAAIHTMQKMYHELGIAIGPNRSLNVNPFDGTNKIGFSIIYELFRKYNS